MTSDLDKGGLVAAKADTDRELWRESDDAFASSVHITETGGLGINVNSRVIVKTLAAWHALASHQPATGDTQAAAAPDGLEVVGWARLYEINGPCLGFPAYLSRADLERHLARHDQRHHRFAGLVLKSAADALIAAQQAEMARAGLELSDWKNGHAKSVAAHAVALERAEAAEARIRELEVENARLREDKARLAGALQFCATPQNATVDTIAAARAALKEASR